MTLRREDRHLELLQLLRDGRTHRAADLARRLGVSTRTIWRDMEALAAAGLPLSGTRGAGYRLQAAALLPPLALSGPEFDALRLGLAVVEREADPELRAAARQLSARVGTLLAGHRLAPVHPPSDLRPFTQAARGFAVMPTLRRAIRERRRLDLREARADGSELARVVRPLRMDYLGRLWTLTAWCELRRDFRVFRVERLRAATMAAPFTEEAGKRLSDYLARFSDGPDGN